MPTDPINTIENFLEEIKYHDEKSDAGPWFQRGPLEEDETGTFGGLSVDLVKEQDEGNGEASYCSLIDEVSEENVQWMAFSREALPIALKIIRRALEALNLLGEGEDHEHNIVQEALQDIAKIIGG